MANPTARAALKSLIVVAGSATDSLGGYGGALRYAGNFHAVSEGALYRSAQLTKEQFSDAIRQYRIKSILNLRGTHPGQPWYDEEIQAARDAGVEHYDCSLSAKRVVSDASISAILEILRAAPKPLLIHCKSGADRSGLVAALFLFAIAGASSDEADRQLSLAYGHFPYLTSKTGAMDESFWVFVHHSGDMNARR
jgi:protein tyrosine/serine phosphatase